MSIKLLVYFYTMIQPLIKCILMGLITYLMFESKIIYMWFKKINQSEWNLMCYYFLYHM
jgi:hypothetical protein